MVSDNAKKLSVNYKTASLLEAVIEYYLFCEMSDDMILPEDVVETQSHIELIKSCFNDIVSGKDIVSYKEALDTCRKDIIEKMQVLTSYVDKFLVYEYVLNRIEAKYKMTEEELKEKVASVDVEKFVSELASYILSSDEPAAINERIREIIEQLPVRMARSKFIEYIKNSVKLYEDSDVSSLDGYLYMIRTAAMIYKPEGIDTHFVQFGDVIEELSGLDYKNLTKEAYEIYTSKLKVTTSKINDISDIYVSLQKIVNALYTYILNIEACIDENVYMNCMQIAGIVNNIFNGTDSGEDADEYFAGIEGVMEELYEERLLLEAMLGKEISKEDDIFEALSKSEKLLSTSLFADIENEACDEPVTEGYLERAVNELVADLQEVINNNDRLVVRAVYASVLGKLPVFFESMQEVVNYITDSISGCGDNAELVAVYSLLDDVSADDFNWSE